MGQVQERMICGAIVSGGVTLTPCIMRLVHAYWQDRVEGIHVPEPFVSALLSTLISGSSLHIRLDVPC
jgi:hypothetical protein